VRTRGEEKAIKVLKTLTAAKRAPVATHEIRAVEACLFDESFGWRRSAFDLVTIIRSKSVDGWRGEVLAKMTDNAKIAVWKAVAHAWVAGRR
jgi:hypothetical protein